MIDSEVPIGRLKRPDFDEAAAVPIGKRKEKYGGTEL